MKPATAPMAASGTTYSVISVAGGVGSALLQLGRLAGLTMYGTCSARGASAVTELGGIPIDYQRQDFVQEIHRLTGDGVGMHIGILPGYPASHGCIRMAPHGAEMFYNRVKVGTPVEVTP